MKARCPGGWAAPTAACPAPAPAIIFTMPSCCAPAARRASAMLCPSKGLLWERLMQPFLLAALNTEPEECSAQLAGAVLRETLAQGRPCLSPAHRHAQPGGGLRRSGARLSWSSKGAPGASGRAAAQPCAFDRARGPGAGISRRHLAAATRRHGDPGGAALGRPRILSPACRARRIPRHRQRPFPFCRACRRARHPGRDRRHGGMDLHLSRTASRSPCRAPTPSSTATARSWPASSGPMSRGA